MKQGPAAKRRRLSSDQEEQVIGLYLLVRQLQIPVDGGGGKIPWIQLMSALVFRYLLVVRRVGTGCSGYWLG